MREVDGFTGWAEVVDLSASEHLMTKETNLQLTDENHEVYMKDKDLADRALAARGLSVVSRSYNDYRVIPSAKRQGGQDG